MKSYTLMSIGLLLSLLLAASVTVIEARGGRRGGSFGGIFGGWRKYKKPSNGGVQRRITNGTPMQTAASRAESIGAGGMKSTAIKSATQSKTHASYPRHSVPNGGYGGYHGSAPLPPGGSYYANTASMPPGAVYYAQPPMRSSGTGDFMFGMMAGHVMSHGLFGQRHYVQHIHQQGPPPTDNGAGGSGKVIIINNGEASANVTEMEKATEAQNPWPTDTDVPLAEFNTSVTPEDTLKPGMNAIFQRVAHNQPSNNQIINLNSKAQTPVEQQQQVPQPPPGGIICAPMLFNEPDPSDATKTLNIEKMVCYPAPPPPPKPSNPDCIVRTVSEVDPNDSTKTIDVYHEDCSFVTDTPPVVFGDIGESSATTQKQLIEMLS